MRIRYKKEKGGRLVQQARLYQASEHGLSSKMVDSRVLKILSKLRERGYQALIVGGAVRDLLLGKNPKDFDIVTDAQPTQVRALFSNSRTIGRRFRLVHVYFGGDKIYEVATFRSRESSSGLNLYGTLEEDARRRDFTMNGLYFCPHADTIYDYVGGVKDIQKRLVRCIIPQNEIFDEDPVRMIRAVKYAAITESKIPRTLRKSICDSAPLLADCSYSRITEEVLKILQSGFSCQILQNCLAVNLFSYLLPIYFKMFSHKTFQRRFFDSLQRLDHQTTTSEASVGRAHMVACLVEPYLEKENLLIEKVEWGELFSRIKKSLLPVVAVPNKEIEEAIRLLCEKWNIVLLGPSPIRRRARIHRGPSRDRQRPHSRHKGGRPPASK